MTNESIVPFYDLINHSDEPCLQSGFDREQGGITLIATRDIKRGTQLNIDYAEDEPKCWLLDYGFVNSEKNLIPINFTLSETDPMYAEKI